MARSQESFNKKEKEKKRLKKRLDKQKKMEERKTNPSGGSFDDMLAYVDEDGNISDTPPDPTKKKKIIASTIEIGIPKKTADDTPSVHKGRVEFFNDSKGFGFIKELDSHMKYFVHITAIADPVAEGDIVTFEVERGLKGMNAIKVAKADSNTPTAADA